MRHSNPPERTGTKKAQSGIHSVLRLPAILFFLFGLVCPLSAQIDTASVLPRESLEALEDFFQNSGEEGDFDFNAIFDQLQAYQERPLDLNKAEEGDLRDLGLLTDVQILNFLEYRRQAGDLLAVYELQVVPGFDQNTIFRILPFVGLNTALDDYQVGLGKMLGRGRNELILRWTRILEEQQGYLPGENPDDNRYRGSPDQLYFRYRHSYSNRLSFGLTAEKDRGEEFFKGSNPNGFDYYSAHFYLRDYRSWLKAVAVGDFNISFGQGLILYSGFGYGKSAIATSIKRTGRTVLPYASVNESLFMRGAALELAPGKNWTIAVFGSSRRRDANLNTMLDSVTNEVQFASITSFNDAGLHRTLREIEDEDAIQQTTTGGNIKYKAGENHFAFNVLYDQIDKPLIINQRPYNQFNFSDDRLLNMSVDYSMVYRNFNFFGETAWSANGAVATINGLVMGLSKNVDLAVSYRNFSRNYQALNANPLAETSGGRNEKGFYLGMAIRPAARWTLTGYFDQFEFPWLRFQVDAPTRGYEYRLRLTYEERRRLRVYVDIRNEVKPINAPDNTTAYNFTVPRSLFQTRLHIANQLNKTLELRTRVDWGYVENPVESRQTGFVILQDLIVRPADFPLSFSMRYAIYDTDSYSIRFYHFENDVLNTFSIPAYYNQGTRFYINMRYRPSRKLTLEFRYAQTYRADQEKIGSGLEATEGPVQSQVRAQVRYIF